jgi:hypothetical protein
MPASVVRLSAGREGMSEHMQALCFLAGANSIFYGEKLLTTGNPEAERDRQLFAKLGLVGLGVAGGTLEKAGLGAGGRSAAPTACSEPAKPTAQTCRSP